MFVLVLQTLALMAIAVILGCLCGYWLRVFLRMRDGSAASTGRASAVSAANAVRVATSGELAAQVAKVQRVFSPAPAKEPEQETAKPAKPADAIPVEVSREPVVAPTPATKPAKKVAAKAQKAAKPKTVKAEKVVKPAEVKSDSPPAAAKRKPAKAAKPSASGTPAAKAAEPKAAKANKVAKPATVKSGSPPAAVKSAPVKTTRPVKAAKASVSALAKPSAAAKTAKPKSEKAAKAGKVAKSAAAKVAAPAAKDDLKLISGIGRQNEAKLNAAGITAYSQIAAWTKKQQAEMGEMLAFPGRMEREDWVGQAKVLAKGGKTAFAKRVAEGDVPTSVSPAKAAGTGKKPASRKKS